jgi:hypothetical protein
MLVPKRIFDYAAALRMKGGERTIAASGIKIYSRDLTVI